LAENGAEQLNLLYNKQRIRPSTVEPLILAFESM